MVYRDMNTIASFASLPDHQLLVEVKRLAHAERGATAALIASLAEVDARRLYLGQGCSSLFTYCTRVLHLSEHAAYGRIEAARAARRCPRVLEAMASGSVTLTTVTLLAPHLTVENEGDLLASADHKSDIEHIVAALKPKPDVAATIRKVPMRTVTPASPQAPVSATTLLSEHAVAPDTSGVLAPAASPALSVPQLIAPFAPPARAAVIAPLAAERYKVQFTVGRETHDKLRRAQDLLRHALPTGDPAEIFDRALTLLVEHLEKTKLADTKRPRTARPVIDGSRHIPAVVRRAVWQRDKGRCGFVGSAGRCAERGWLEFHHVVPYADGGAATVENIVLRRHAYFTGADEPYDKLKRALRADIDESAWSTLYSTTSRPFRAA